MKIRMESATAFGPPPRAPGFNAAAPLLLFAGLMLGAESAPAAVRFQIHPPEEVLAAAQGGRPTGQVGGSGLRFTDLNGRTWDLITDINDPSITNRGSGTFHPAQVGEVELALKAIRGDDMSDFVVDVFILPYPRRGLLASSADGDAVYISPGVYPYAAAQLHMLVTHELGHVFQHRFLPDADGAAWAVYRQIRGLTDVALYNESASHRNRPHEIFAEDFRVLFGGQLANYSASIENSALAYPADVPGLMAFIAGQASATAGSDTDYGLVSSPNPFNPLTTLRFRIPGGSHTVRLDIVDAGGRLVRQLAAEVLTEGTYEYRWDGQSTSGSRVASGVYFARLTTDATRSHHRLILAR